MKVVFCTPTITRPYAPYLAALEKSVPLITGAGWEEGCVFEVGNSYISAARAILLRKALDAKADVIVFIDHDLSWDAPDLLTLIETPGDVVAGTYRFKQPEEKYMGWLAPSNDGRPVLRSDGCIKADCVPAGFLKITSQAVERFITAYPRLCYGPNYSLSVDLFNHGAHKGVWYGEDYAFCRNWRDAGGDVWIVPNLNLTHWGDDTPFHGNFHEFMLLQPGGANDPRRRTSNG